MAELVVPTVDLWESWLDSLAEWGDENQDGSGLRPDDDMRSATGFATWVDRLRRESDPAVPVEPGRVRASYWWIVEGGTYLGAVTLRHELTSQLLDGGGHIGYSIRPSARRRGLASWALAAVLDEARQLGLERLLVTCDDANAASARTIERNGGVLEDIRETWLGRTRRYWIELRSSPVQLPDLQAPTCAAPDWRQFPHTPVRLRRMITDPKLLTLSSLIAPRPPRNVSTRGPSGVGGP